MWNPIKKIRHRQKHKKMIHEMMKKYKEEIPFPEELYMEIKCDHTKDVWYPPKDKIRIVDGVKYRVIRHRCVCGCHTSGAIHIAPCCNGGFKESLEKIEE